jgi:hypothetical protein
MQNVTGNRSCNSWQEEWTFPVLSIFDYPIKIVLKIRTLALKSLRLTVRNSYKLVHSLEHRPIFTASGVSAAMAAALAAIVARLDRENAMKCQSYRIQVESTKARKKHFMTDVELQSELMSYDDRFEVPLEHLQEGRVVD